MSSSSSQASGVAETSPAAPSPSVRVTVGPFGQFVFVPNTVFALANESVTFEIASPHYIVAQSVGVGDPCAQIGLSSRLGDPALDVFVGTTEPIYALKFQALPNASVIWDNLLKLFQIFCPPHCSSGMVMIINPKSSTEIDSFVAAAQGRVLPGQTSITTGLSAGASTTTELDATDSPIRQTGSTGTGSAKAAIILGGVLGASTLLACALAIAFVIRRRIRKRATFGQPRALRPPSAGVAVRERNALKEKVQAAEPSSDARIDESGQGDSGTDARLQAALEALAALQTEVQELRQADTAETLPEYEPRDGA